MANRTALAAFRQATATYVRSRAVRKDADRRETRGKDETNVIEGALGGVKATALMSTVFLLHPDATVPPKLVTDNILRTIGRRPITGAWLPAHFAFGLTLGALRARSGTPRVPFALAVWAATYATSLPALGLYPPLTRDHRRRAAASLLAHVVFGATLPK